jgi:inosose dehydratase
LFLKQASEIGYKALELGPDGYLPTEANRLQEILGHHGLSVCAGTACYAFDRYDSFEGFRPRIEALCERIRSLGGRYLVTMDESNVGLYSEKKADYSAALWDKYLGMFQTLGRFTEEEFGIQTVYHPHIRSLIETEEEIIRLMDHTGLDLCFDTGHHAYVNGNGQPGDPSAADFLRRYATRIPYLHFKQIDGAVYAKVLAENLDSDTAFDINVMCDLPDGIIDFREIKQVLDDIGFDGIAVVESDMPRATNEQAAASAKRNLDYLKEIHLMK